jgi:PAS domain S-box-containing protein
MRDQSKGWGAHAAPNRPLKRHGWQGQPLLEILLLGLAIMFALWLPVSAQAGQVAVNSADHYVLDTRFDVLEDASGELSFEDILSVSQQEHFKPASPTGVGISRSVHWFRVDLALAPSASARWMLELANTELEHADVYLQVAGGKWVRQVGGNALPFSQREVQHRFPVFVLNLQADASQRIYLRLQTERTLSMSAKLWQPLALMNDSQRSNTLLSLYFGLMIGLSLYNLMLFFSIRDRAYLVYVGFAVSLLFYQLGLTGLGVQYLWGDYPWFTRIATTLGVTLAMGLATLFTRYFLSIPQRTPSLDKLLQVIIGVWALLVVLTWLAPDAVSITLVTEIAVVTLFLLIGTGIYSAHQGHREARYFLLSGCAIFLGAGLHVFYVTGLVEATVLTANSILIGSAIDMVILSFALADQVSTARKENDRIQRQNATEQAKVQALSQSQAHYLSVIEQVREGMVVIQDNQAVFANAQAAALLSCSQADVLRQGIVAMLHPEDQAALRNRIATRLSGGTLEPVYEARRVWPDGSTHCLELGDARVPWNGGTGVLVFFLDQTERKNAERDTELALARQRELNDLRSRFVAMTSHEFRTPLTGIRSSYDLLKTYDTRLSPKDRHDVLEVISNGVQRMMHMLDRVLLLGKSDAQMLEFKPNLINLHALCHQLIAEAGAQLLSSQCELQSEIHVHAEEALFDEKLLRHIFSNLLSNAIKYSPPGGEVRFCVKQTQKAGEQRLRTVFTVSDQGIGIPADEIGDLFESFHRARNVGDIAGTGLGLAIVKSSVTLHGGEITVSSELGKGSCFTVTI